MGSGQEADIRLHSLHALKSLIYHGKVSAAALMQSDPHFKTGLLYVYTCVYAPHVCGRLQRSEESTRYPETEVTSSCGC